MISHPELLFEANNIDNLIKVLNFSFTPDGYSLALNNTMVQRDRFNFYWEEEYYTTVVK
jgi:hypothetical protein